MGKFKNNEDEDQQIQPSTKMDKETGILYLFGPVCTENVFPRKL